MAARPVIGLSLDVEPAGGWSHLPWYALRRNYVDAVEAAGGLPLLLPHHPERAADYLAQIDGLLIPGGAFDHDPELFGAAERHPTVKTKPGRTAFELALIRLGLARDLPMLGICGGQQLMAVALGGTLHQHIPDAIEAPLEHEQDKLAVAHPVEITPGTRLAAIVGAATIAVNTAHHQAVATTGPDLVVNARAPDGVIEGVERTDARFCVGVQWHPEYLLTDADRALMAAFIAAAQD